jgi:hypothetical protein
MCFPSSLNNVPFRRPSIRGCKSPDDGVHMRQGGIACRSVQADLRHIRDYEHSNVSVRSPYILWRCRAGCRPAIDRYMRGAGLSRSKSPGDTYQRSEDIVTAVLPSSLFYMSLVIPQGRDGTELVQGVMAAVAQWRVVMMRSSLELA